MEEFEDRIDEIDELLIRNRGKWQLDAITWMDYEDVCQIIRHHIYNKWHLWDQSRPFRPWASTVICHQIRNQIRNNYLNFAKPCSNKCEFNTGGDTCGKTESGKQDSTCPLYAKWLKGKKKAHDVKLPLSMDDNLSEITSNNDTFMDYDSSAEELHLRVLEKLKNERHREVYRLLFVQGKSEDYVAEKLGFKKDTSSERKSKRYKQLNNLQKRFYELAKEIISEEDIC